MTVLDVSSEGLGETLALYIHWPFCKAKCPYCDFNSHVRHGFIDEDSFLEAFFSEMRFFHERVPKAKITSIFFGGGTPSLLSAGAVSKILDRIASLWICVDGCEVTLEANPTSVEAERFRGYKLAGVTRISLGVQSLREEALKALGRQHTVEEARSALALAQRFFSRVSFDLIYARPYQTLEDWRSELKQALALCGGHLSLYQLTVEPNTPYARLYREGKLKIPNEDLALDLYLLTQELTEKEGMFGYEISNHALPGQESHHNLTYWRYGSYAGIGPGAHSRLNVGGEIWGLMTEKNPETWRQCLAEKGEAFVEKEKIPKDLQASERLLMGLRLREGVHEKHFSNAQISLDRLLFLVEQGFLQQEGGYYKATLRGRCVLNALLKELLS